jgi:phosphorylcholine metabolism protein LicD
VYGTLLGAYRDKDFISHDIDIDIGAFFHEYSKDIEKVLQKYGFIKKHEFLVDDGKFAIEETYIYKKIPIDIFYFKQEKNKLIGYVFSNEPNLSWDATIEKYGGLLVREDIISFNGINKINFLGKNFNILKNSEEHLILNYGENFMIPDPEWNDNKIREIKFLKNKIAIMKKK